MQGALWILKQYQTNLRRPYIIFVGIDVSKDKHDCFITNTDGEVLFKSFTITNNLDGFDELYQKIESVMEDVTKVKVGLEATGHYSYNLLGYLLDKGFPTHVIVLIRLENVQDSKFLFQDLSVSYFQNLKSLFQLYTRIQYMNCFTNFLAQSR